MAFEPEVFDRDFYLVRDVPEGFDQVHDRGGIQHRLKDESKWVPLGIGPGGDEGGEEGE